MTKKGTHVYDLRKDLKGLHGGKWSEVSFDKAGRDFLEDRWRAQVPNMEQTFFKFLMLETGVDLCDTEE